MDGDTGLTLGEFRAVLRAVDEKYWDHWFVGLGLPHSYRGVYSELAFEYTATTIRKMHQMTFDVVGQTFQGYKGGDYTMDIGTYCNVATFGSIGHPLTTAELGSIVFPMIVEVFLEEGNNGSA